MTELTKEEFRQEMLRDAYEEQEEARREVRLSEDFDGFYEYYEAEIQEAREMIKALSDLYRIHGHDFDVRELEY